MPPPIIEVSQLGKDFRAGRALVHALADVSFTVAEGQFVTLVGPSGCGKSTLLQILAGLIGPTCGEARIDGKRVSAPMPDKIGMVFQDPTLLPWKTALANVEFPLDLRGVARAARRERCSALIELVGLRDFAEHYPHELSGGMRQRVAIARGLAQDPRLILMDEPFAALDEQTRTRMGHDLLDIWDKTRKTVFFITHSVDEAVFDGDEPATRTDSRDDRDRLSTAARPRRHRQRGLRPHPQPHLAPDRGGRDVMQPRLIKTLIITAIALAAWEAVVGLGFVNQIILAAPSAIVGAAITDGRVFLAAFATTVLEIVAAIIIAWTLGIIVGVVAGSSNVLAAATAPVLSSIFAIPLIIVYPLLMAWLGIGPVSKIVFGVLSGFFPIALNTIDGVRAIERRYLVFARSIGATTLQTYARIIFPLALPSIVSGLRVGTGLVVIGVIVTEMLASLGGVGFLISYHRTLFNTGHVYFGIALALTMAVAVNVGLTWLDRRVGLWRILERTDG